MLVTINASYFHKSLKRINETVKLNENSTIHDLFTTFHKLCVIPEKRYNRYYKKWVSVFWGSVVIKNDHVVGHYEEDGLKILEEKEITLKNGDKVVLVLPVGGG